MPKKTDFRLGNRIHNICLAALTFLLIFLFLPAAASGASAKIKVPAGTSPDDGILKMQNIAQENIMFKEEQAAFFYTIKKPGTVYPGNAMQLDFDASHSKTAYVTIKTAGLEIIPESLVVHEYEEDAAPKSMKITYDQKMLTGDMSLQNGTSGEYRIDLDKTHKYDASFGTLYFRFTGGEASLTIELTENGLLLHKKTYNFAVNVGRGTVKLVKTNDAGAQPERRQGSVSFGIGLNGMKGATEEKIKSYLNELKKLDWLWTALVKATGDIQPVQEGSVPVPKDSISGFGRVLWFIKSIDIKNETNKTGTIQLILDSPINEFKKYETVNGQVKVSFEYAYTPWKYELINKLLDGSAAQEEAVQNSNGQNTGGQNSTGQNTGGQNGTGQNESATAKKSTAPSTPNSMSNVVKYVVIPAGTSATAVGVFLILLFVFRSISYFVRIFSYEKPAPGNDKLIKEMRVSVKSKTPVDIDLTGAYDYTGSSALKIVWNPKVFRGKHDITIRYLFDGKLIHEDFFRNSKEAVTTRIIEMEKVQSIT